MKRTLLSVSALYLTFSAFSQTIVVEEDFDAYGVGDLVGVVSPAFTTWLDVPGTNDGPISDTYAASGANSMRVMGPAGGGDQDMVLPLGDQTTGVYDIEFRIYVEQGAGAYFNVLHTWEPAGQNFEWGLDVFFSMSGTGTINANGNNSAAFNYTNAAWTDVLVSIDLDASMAELTIGGTSVHTWPWEFQNNGMLGVNVLAAVNFFSTAATGEDSDYYIDDVVVTEVTGVGVEENSTVSLGTFPNPVEDVLTVEVAGFNPATATMQLLDLTGKVVGADLPTITTSLAQTLNVDLGDLPNGVYFLTLTDGGQQLVEKVVKQ